MKKFTPLILLAFSLLLAGCSNKANQIEISPENTKAILIDGTYRVDPEASTLYWEAFKAVGGHMGGISLKQGELVVQNEIPTQGSFVIDMASITNTDLENKAFRKNLVNNLKSDDFFSVADYPTAIFDITRVLPYKGEGDYNFEIEGDLSLRGVTQPVTILTKIQINEKKLTAFARTEIDRTQFNIITRSDSFFEKLEEQLIKDSFIIEMDLVANRL